HPHLSHVTPERRAPVNVPARITLADGLDGVSRAPSEQLDPPPEACRKVLALKLIQALPGLAKGSLDRPPPEGPGLTHLRPESVVIQGPYRGGSFSLPAGPFLFPLTGFRDLAAVLLFQPPVTGVRVFVRRQLRVLGERDRLSRQGLGHPLVHGHFLGDDARLGVGIVPWSCPRVLEKQVV